MQNQKKIQADFGLPAELFDDEQMKELRRRANLLKYFQGAGDFRSGEGFGYLVGGALLIVMGGVIFPLILSGHSDTGVERYLFWIMTALGVYLGIKGVIAIRHEDRTPRTPITDEQFEEILDYDLTRAKTAAEAELTETFALTGECEFIHLVGPNYYTANRHIPLLWKADANGQIRYSNLALVTLAFDGGEIYSFSCIVNLRDGILSKPNSFLYTNGQIGGLLIEDREVERLSSEHKIEKKNVLMLLFRIEGREEINELSVVLADHDVERKTGGFFDQTEARAAAEIIQNKLAKN